MISKQYRQLTPNQQNTNSKQSQQQDYNQFKDSKVIQTQKHNQGYYPNTNQTKHQLIQNNYLNKPQTKSPNNIDKQDKNNQLQKLDENQFLSTSQKNKLKEYIQRDRSISAPYIFEQKCSICHTNIIVSEELKLSCNHSYHRKCLSDFYFRFTNTSDVKCLECQRQIENQLIRKFVKPNTSLSSIIFDKELSIIFNKHVQFLIKCRFCEFFCIISISYFEKEINSYCPICQRYTVFEKFK